jgi:hypothetical protein
MFFVLWANAFANPIVNGELETEFPSTVALGGRFGENAFSSCTGNLITPKIILSAGHCGEDLPIELVLQFGEAFFGNSVAEIDYAVGFSDLNIHPDYEELEGTLGGSLGAYDFGLLVLQEEAPIQPTLFRTEPLSEEHIGTDLISVGFGITGADQNDSGVKRSAALTLDELDEMFIISNSNTNANNANICSGDSGGPMFFFDEELGEYVQWAVHSWGDQTCQITSGSTRTDLVADWIFETIESVHGTTDMCEINGYYDDDECTEMDICQAIDPACIEEEEPEKGACNSTGSSTLPYWLITLIPFLYRRK